MIKQHGSDPATTHFAITPHDVNPVKPTPRVLYAATAGNIVIKDEANTSVTYAVTAGQILPFRPYIVTTASTATVIGWL